ncbi:SDR family NAD(P)-dependent oxidoreductase [Paraburkholderia sp. CNPSo 3272]|nr:SDR family NAD(P)-dependent oxidoreductase [Paraburkholderia sp. CNPSo 3272]MCP3726129.1 SDR family NAD(P)-dependent oxidoreductase [Paraburkholderia sp. CNPSo 3272]
MKTLAGKTALVTGASRGIGRATALALAQAGAQIIVHYGHSAREATTVVAEITAAGSRAHAIQADLAESDGPHRLARQVRTIVGERLDILVANAAIAKAAALEETGVEDFDELFAVNVRAPYFLVQQLLPIMRKGSNITLLSSLATVFCTTEFLPVGLLRYISQGLSVTEGTAGIMVTAPGLLAAIAAPFLTVAVGRFDRRRVLLGLGVLLVILNLAAMLAPNFPVLVVARAMFGFGIGGFWAISVALGSRLVPEEHVGRATSMIFAGVSLGMLIGGPAGALIAELAGWRTAFGAALAMSIAALLAQCVSLPSLHVERAICSVSSVPDRPASG